ERDGAEQQQQRPKAAQTGPAIRQVNQVEVVTFQDPTKKRNTQSAPSPNKIPALQITEREQSDQLGELSLEKARLEVHRFGITGYRKEQQRVFEQDRAVMLGGRPPKKEYVNYKVLQEQIKKQKEKVKEEHKVHPSKTTLPSGPGAAPSGQLGRFKNGMLILNSKEIQKIKGSK
uniref:Zgc:194224 n=1 Tax=Amphilophus citrinellus TaxID=61819 RepID=A0A3Q0RK86_AMPCI